MSMRELARATSMRIALGVLAIAIVVVGWTLVRAFREQPIAAGPPIMVANLETIARGAARPPSDIQAAFENDLFAADRTAPGSPYRMPGESNGEEKPVVQPMKPVVLGTAVATDGRSFATVQLGDASPTLVRVGDKIGEWVVKAIERGKVVLVSTTGTRADLTVPKPGT